MELSAVDSIFFFHVHRPHMAAPQTALSVPEKYALDKVAYNHDVLGRARTFASLLAGAVAGVLGLTGVAGFAFFILCNVATSAAVAHLCCNKALLSASALAAGGDITGQFFMGRRAELFSFSALTSGVLTFVLVWMIVYDGIYVF